MLDALDLQPARAIPRPIGRVAQLAHDALEAHCTRLLEDERRLHIKVLGEVEARGLGVVEQGREDALALDERRLSEIESVEVEQVEGEVDHALRAAGGEIGLQRVEVGDAGVALHDHLAVEDEVVGRQLPERGGERGEPVGPVVPPPREEARAAALEMGLDTVAVVLDFGEPSLARWRDPQAQAAALAARTAHLPLDADGMRRQALHDLRAATAEYVGLSDGRRTKLFNLACKCARYVVHGVLTENEFRVAWMDAARANGALAKHGPVWAVTTIRNAINKAQGDPLPPLARAFRTGGSK